MEKIYISLTGLAGIIGIQLIGGIDPDQLSKLAQLLVQIIIAIASIWGIFKKKRP